ncbi:MAG TPA: hypothetical protein VGF53_10395 [Pseudolabrys sp.]
MRKSLLAAITGVATLGFLASPSIAQDDTDQKLGTVHFATSCNETAQRRFDRAMRYQHSFWYKASREIFEETLKADPTCGIAYWGMALGLLDNPHNPPPAPNLPLGLAAIQAAKATGAKTQRERDFIDALAVMYVDYDKTPHGARVQSYLKAMEALAAKYPDDDEAQIFYAITLNVAASPTDKTYANQLKGAAILEAINKRQPRHPGVLIISFTSMTLLRSRRKGSTPPGATPRSRRLRRMRSTCPRTSSLASVSGKTRSHPIWPPCKRQRRTSHPVIRCTGRTIWSTPICNSTKTRMHLVLSTIWPSALSARMHSQRISHWPRHQRATWWNAEIGKARRSFKSVRTNFPMSWRSPISPALSAPRAPEILMLPRPKSQSLLKCVTT